MAIVEYRGKRIQVPDDATDEELTTFIDQIDVEIDEGERAERVKGAAGQMYQDARVTDESWGGAGEIYNDARNWLADVPYAGHISEAILGSETRPSPLHAMANEAARNLLVDIPANVAGATQPTYGGTENFSEQRDAHRAATDMFTSASGLPSWVDDLSSLGGVLASPGLKGGGAAVRSIRGGGRGATAGRVATAGGAGALEGAMAGALESDQRDLASALEEALLYGGIGGALGLGGQAGAEAIGKGYRGAYADDQTAQRYDTQQAAGYPSTAGSIGNENMAMLENTLRDAPASWARMTPLTPDVRTAQTTGNKQIDALFEHHRNKVSGDQPLTAASDFNKAAEGAVVDAGQSIRTEIQDTGEELIEAVGADTPTKIRQVEEVPGNLNRASRGGGVISRTQSDVSDLSRERPRGGPVNDELAQVLGARFNTLSKEQKKLEKQIANNLERQEMLRAKGRARQADRLNTRLTAPEGLKKQLGDVKKQIETTQKRARDNMGAPFRAVMDWRSDIGNQGDQASGLRSYEKDVLYAPGTRAMESASEDFKPLNDKLREAYGDDKELGKWFGEKTNYATAFPKLYQDGRMDVIEVMERRMDPQDYAQLRGSVIHKMGMRTNKGTQEWSDVAFAGQWNKLGDEAKIKLAGSEETKVLFDSLVEVTGSLKNLKTEVNTSKSGVSGGILASLAVGSLTAAKFFGRVGIADSAVASKALTEALAGKPNKLNQLLRSTLVASETRDPQHREEGADTYAPLRDAVPDLGNN